MAKQTTLWTALPNGYSDDGRSLRLSVMVSPRLEPSANPELQEFPDFEDWPATLAQARFTVHFGAAPAVTISGHDFQGPTRVGDRLGLPDSVVWTALFPKETFVQGFQFRDLSQHSVLSYPAVEMDALVRGLYSRLAASASDQLPEASAFLDDPAWGEVLNAVARLDEEFVDRKRDRKTGRFTAVRNPARQFAAFKNHAFDKRNLPSDLARFQLFHTPPSTPRRDRYDVPPEEARSRAEWLGYERTELPKPAEFQNQIDFHRIVAAMNQYPTLLRRLGLTVDLLIARDAFPPAPDALLWVEVELPQGSPDVERMPDASPRTHTLLDGSRFQAVPRPAPKPGDFRVADGLLDLDPNTFRFVQTDVDGAGLKVTNFARSLLTMRGEPDHQTDPVTKQKRELGAPALRNAGLVLVHTQRADMLKNAIARQAQFNAAAEKIRQGVPNPPPPPALHAEDLVRGYRVDIWDSVSGRWHSLCRRQANYEVDGGAAVINVPEEEGTVRLAATTSPDPASNPDIIWLHETLVAWPGWSLCAPAPGRTIAHDPTDHSDPVTDAEAEVPPGLRLKSAFKAVAGSLPRLRYGRSYRLRARVVDLAGNSLALQPKDFGSEPPKNLAQPYYRYEPISAPAIALVKPTPATIDAPAEGESMERMAIRSFNDTPPLNVVPTVQRARRFSVPSRITQRDAEQHGMLDAAGIVDPAFFAMLAAKDDSLPEEKILTAGPLAGGAPVEAGYAALIDGDALPYIPDPLAMEIAARIFDHPSFPDSKLLSIPLYDGTGWPDALPFKVEIYDDPGEAPHYDAAARTLFIPLPKASRCTLRLSVRPNDEALRILGVWNWLTAAQQTKTVVINGQPTTLEKLARRGQHWMLTPWRNIELVHAVQRPLITPELMKLTVERHDNATFALPSFIAPCSIASTDRIDLRANWNDPFEDGEADVLENRARMDHAFSVKITDAKSYAGNPDYIPQGTDLIGVGRRIHDRLPQKMHEFHDTRYRRIEYWIEATSKFREFLPASLLTEVVGGETRTTEENIKVVGPKLRTWIPCSAPPPAPEVLYVVPTFGWVRSGDEARKTSWRRGGGLRVYLNRNWNASGYGEMLAVVLPGAAFKDDPNDKPTGQPLKNFVTQWGNDPIWLSPFVSGSSPGRGSFPLARTAADPDGKWLPTFAPAEEADQPAGPFQTTGLEHPELRSPTADTVVDIAPHDVHYDDERKLWYCDIEVAWGAAYFPFVRLALARYQPVALHGAHLSNVVLADFMPLVPDRWLNVTQTRERRTRLVKVFGHTFTDSSGHVEAVRAPAASQRLPDGTILDLHAPSVAPSSVVEVWVERLDASLGEDFGWKRVPDAIVQDRRANVLARPDIVSKPAVAHVRSRASDLMIHREFEAILDEDLIDHIFVTPVLWDGSVTLPEVPHDGARYRLAIAEYEEYLVDDASPYDRFPTKKDRRLVFIEFVEVV